MRLSGEIRGRFHRCVRSLHMLLMVRDPPLLVYYRGRFQRRIQKIKKAILSVVDLDPSQTTIGTNSLKEITMKFMMLMIHAVYLGGKPAPGFTPDPKKMEEMGHE